MRAAHQRLVTEYLQQRDGVTHVKVGDRVWMEEGATRGKKAKLQRKAHDPYIVIGALGNGTYQLEDLNGEPLKSLVNGRHLRPVRLAS